MHKSIKFILQYAALGVLLAVACYAVQPYLGPLTRPGVAIRVAAPQPQPSSRAATAGHADTVERIASTFGGINLEDIRRRSALRSSRR